MKEYKAIRSILAKLFNSSASFSEEFSIELYREEIGGLGKMRELEAELELAFSDASLSWREMLFNKDYEVDDFKSEQEAFAYAKRVLWSPIFGSRMTGVELAVRASEDSMRPDTDDFPTTG